MTRVVETVARSFGESLRWEKVITKELRGAARCKELSRALGRPAPVPSIFINGRLIFESTPSVEELREHLEKLLGAPAQEPG